MSQLRGRRRRLNTGPTRTLQTRVSEPDHMAIHAVSEATRMSITELLDELVQTHPALLRALGAASAAGMPLSEYLTSLIVRDELDRDGKPLWAQGRPVTLTPELPGIRQAVSAA